MEEIMKLRTKINEIDEKILDLIAERISHAKEIGVYKKQNGVNIIDKQREEEIMKNLTVRAKERGIDPELVKKIWQIFIDASYRVEE